MLISSVGTIFASGWTNGWKNEFAIVLAVLLVENATFYPLAWVCARALPKQTTKQQREDPLEGLVLVEALDVTLRLLCFWLALKYPGIKGWLTGTGSLLLDVVFLVSLSKSHQLLEIVSRSSTIIKARYKARFGYPRIISLDLAVQPA